MAWVALIPAAGVGSRFGATIPKQYAPILGKPLLQHTVNVLANHALIERVVVVIAPDDVWFAERIVLPDKAMVLPVGGATRAESVAQGVAYLLAQRYITADDWLLVHDAARCCLPLEALNRLLAVLAPDTAHCGALLAMPVSDTLKQQNTMQHSQKTLSREGIWQAQTPQAFPAQLLHHALQRVDLSQITDEASALEQLGIAPKLVLGDRRNIKVTHPEDADLAAYFLDQNH